MTDQAPFAPIPSVEALGAVGVTNDIVTAYVAHNAISRADLTALITEVHRTVIGLYSATPAPAPEAKLEPAVPIRKSVTPDHITCLDCGASFKSLRRHLTSEHNLTPQAYRERWGLPVDYPMVAPNYSATRSRLAKDNRLGHKH